MNDQGRALLDAALPHMDVTYQVARHASRDHHHAEDLVQATYLRAFAAFEGHRGPSTKAWLVTRKMGATAALNGGDECACRGCPH